MVEKYDIAIVIITRFILSNMQQKTSGMKRILVKELFKIKEKVTKVKWKKEIAISIFYFNMCIPSSKMVVDKGISFDSKVLFTEYLILKLYKNLSRTYIFYEHFIYHILKIYAFE